MLIIEEMKANKTRQYINMALMFNVTKLALGLPFQLYKYNEHTPTHARKVVRLINAANK